MAWLIVKDASELDSAMAEAAKYDRKLLIEKFVSGRELTIGILGDQALPILEIIPKGGFYDFTNKYPFLNPKAGGGAEHVCPAKIDPKNKTKRDSEIWRCARFARSAWKVYSRVDMLFPNGRTDCARGQHNSRNDGGEFVAGSGRGCRNQLCRNFARVLSSFLVPGRKGGRTMRPAQRRPQSRNRRVSNRRQRRQQHLLDVKVRSRKATQHRNRRVSWFLSRKSSCSPALCAGVYSATREGAKRLFFENPDYPLSQIEVQTDGTLQREQILKAAGSA